jgi:tetratricopeptide (TPR) repeat protein
MQRRQVLVALGALLPAGCLGAKRPDTATAGVRTEGRPRESTATPEPTPEPTATPEPTPERTETPEPGPSDDAVETGREAIDRVQSAFAAAVEAYTGSEDGVLADVSVTNQGFDVRGVLVALDTVQRELAAADAAAATDDQRDAVADLRVAEGFLTQAALAHSYFGESVDRLDAARAAFDDEFGDGFDDEFDEGLDAVERAEGRFDTALTRGSQSVSIIKNDLASDAVAVAEPFDDDTYETTVSAFESVRSILKDASSGLDRMVQGLDELADAREEEEDGDDDDAEDSADEALDLFDEAYDFFDAAADARYDPDTDRDELEATLERLRDIADDRYREAEDLHDDVS